MSKLTRILLVAAALVCLLATWASAKNKEYTSEYYTYTVEDGTATIVSVDPAISGDVAVPSLLDGCFVVAIGESAFYNCRDITGVTIPYGVTEIGGWAFYNCSALASVTIPDSVDLIGSWAFYNCSSLSSVTIPQGVSAIGSYAFNGCASLADVYLPGSVTSVGTCAFLNCTRLTGVTADPSNSAYKSEGGVLYSKDGSELIYYPASKAEESFDVPAGVTKVADYAFYGCTGLKSVTLPEGLTSIGNWAFGGCTSLASVSLPEGLARIGNSAFYSCSSLSGISLPSSTAEIGLSVFTGCYKLTEISVGSENPSYKSDSSVLYTKDGTMLICYPAAKADSSFYVPDGVSEIADEAFYFCRALTSINFPSSLARIGSRAFYRCEGLLTLNLPEAVSHIGDYAFSDCSALIAIAIPGSTAYIGNGAFFNCNTLEHIAVDEANLSYKSADGALFTKDGTKLLKYPAAKAGVNFAIPGTVTTVAANAFAYSRLVSITIPQSVVSIESNAFWNCARLRNVIVPYSIEAIGTNAFSACYSLSSIVVESGNAEYSSHDGVLYGDGGATLICYPAGIPEARFTVPDNVTAIGGDAFYGCSDLTSAAILSNVISIDNFAFFGCSDLVIYTEASLKPDGWKEYWNGNSPVVWGGIPPESIELSIVAATLPAIGEVLQLDAVIKPDNTTVKKVIWLSSNNSVATVDENGLVTAVNNGTCSIAAISSADHSIVATCEITVNDPDIRYSDGFYTYTVFNGEATVTHVGPSISGVKAIPATLGGYPVVAIGDNAFAQCTELTGIVITESIRAIGSNVWSGCSKLTQIAVEDKNTAYKSDSGVLYTKDGTTLIRYPAGKDNAEFTVPDGITAIADGAFSGCLSLTRLTVSQSVTHVSANAFSGASLLQNIAVSEGNTAYTSEKGVLYSKDKTELVCYPAAKADTRFVIPKSVTALSEFAFSDCSSLTLYAEAESQPEGWHANWNLRDLPVVWGYVAATKITLSKTAETITTVGGKVQLEVIFAPENATLKTVIWTSSNEAVAKVDEKGLVTAVGNGTCTVTATSALGGLTAACEIKVSASIIYGDANGDGVIDTKDLALLRKYLANSNPLTGESTVTVAEGTDNNGDGAINTKDLALLRKYLANSNPLTGESTVVLGPKT